MIFLFQYKLRSCSFALFDPQYLLPSLCVLRLCKVHEIFESWFFQQDLVMLSVKSLLCLILFSNYIFIRYLLGIYQEFIRYFSKCYVFYHPNLIVFKFSSFFRFQWTTVYSESISVGINFLNFLQKRQSSRSYSFLLMFHF